MRHLSRRPQLKVPCSWSKKDSTVALRASGGEIVMSADLSDPKYWRARAEEVMSVARNLVEHEEPMEILYGIAEEYERLAKLAEKTRRHAQDVLSRF